MTESEFLELCFPSNYTKKNLVENYIQISERIEGSDKSKLVQFSTDMQLQKDAVDNVSHEKTEFDICDADSVAISC